MKPCAEMFRECYNDLVKVGGKPKEILAAPDVFRRYGDELLAMVRERFPANGVDERPQWLYFKDVHVVRDNTVPKGTFYVMSQK